MKNIVFDLDGTICFDGINIDEKVLESITRLAKTENVIFASARPIRDMLPVLKPHKELEDCDLIGGNGTIVKKNKVIHSENIERKIVDKTVELACDFGHKILLDSKWNYYYNGDTSSNLYKRIDTDNVACNTAYEKLEEIIKMVILYEDEDLPSILLKYADHTQECHINVYESEKMFDLLPANVNKFTALNKYFGINTDEYIAFGNDTNDIELLNNAKRGYIIGNNLSLDDCKNITLDELVEFLNII